MNIIIDAMSGDHAPAATVRGAVLARAESKVEITLVGQEQAVRRELAAAGAGEDPGIRVVGAGEVIDMHDD
ncbi:MAG: phosphate--acyl-ACP acyltransferase, partial [Oscillospiraceae bacterium]|nr:phosphate--acyl-ACP acyltransferase [Oscillospiraceae bacterium]